MSQKSKNEGTYIIFLGVFCMLVNAGLSFARLVIEVLYFAKRSDSCEEMAKVYSNLDCSKDFQDHLFKDEGFNYIIIVAATDAIIILLSTIIIIKVRKQFVDICLQYTYLIILITNLIIVILSYNQQSKYLSSLESKALQESCDKSDSNPGCDFYRIQKSYQNCLIPFPITQIILSIVLKILMEKFLKEKTDTLIQEQNQKKKIEETTIDLNFYNSRGKPFTVLELYNMGKL